MIQSTNRQMNKIKAIFFKICNIAFKMKINKKYKKTLKKKKLIKRKE